MLNKQNNTYQAIWIGIGSFSSFAFSIISAAILSRYFDKTEYGTYRQILYVYNTLLIIFSAGLPRVFAYFLPRYSLEQGEDIVLKISKMLLLFGIIFSTFLFLFSNLIARILSNPELATGLRYFSPIPMLLLPTLGIEGIFSTYKKAIYIAIYSTFSRLLMLAFIVLPVILLKGTYLYAIYGWLSASAIILVIAYYFKGIPFKNINKEKATLKMNEVLSYSIPLVGASLAGMAIRAADQFYISRYFGAEVFAEYANGFIQIPLVGMITGATSTVLMPQFSKMIHNKVEIEKIADLWQSALIKSAVIIYPMAVFFMLHGKSIVVLLYSETYINSAVFFQIAMVVNFFNIIVFAPLLFSMGETRYYSRMHFIAGIIAWIGGYIIVKAFTKPEYIAIFSVSITIFLIILNMNKISHLLRIEFWNLIPLNTFFKIISHSMLSGFLLLFFKTNYWSSLSNILMLLVDLIVFITLLVLTAKYFNIGYLSIVKPLVSKR